MMKKSETKKALVGKTPKELQTELEALLREQFGLRMQAATQQLAANPKLTAGGREIPGGRAGGESFRCLAACH